MFVGSIAAIFMVLWFIKRTTARIQVMTNDPNLNGDDTAVFSGEGSIHRVEKEPLNTKIE